MQVKNKIFPYPILNKNSLYSNFNDKYFKLIFESEENSKGVILKGATFDTDCLIIKELLNEGKIKICCIIECSYTVYRKKFDVSLEPIDILLNKNDFVDKVEISLFAYATESFIYSPKEVDTDYLGISFEIEEYQIIAVDDGFTLKISHDIAEDRLVKSMFNIIRDTKRDKDNPSYEVDYTQKRINILLAEDAYINYNLIKSVPNYRDIFFNLLLIPTLTEGFHKCNAYLEDNMDIDEINNQYPWFSSIMNGYEVLTGNELTKDDMQKNSPIMLAQMLLRNPLGPSLKNLKMLLTGQKKDGEGYEND